MLTLKVQGFLYNYKYFPKDLRRRKYSVKYIIRINMGAQHLFLVPEQSLLFRMSNAAGLPAVALAKAGSQVFALGYPL